MRIPSAPEAREDFYLDIIAKCLVSRDTRRGDYTTQRAYYLFGAGPEEPPAYFNKINPHLDQLTSFLYSSETTRFSLQLGASVHDMEQRKTPRLTQALNDEWLNSNADQVFSTALTWALVYNTTFVKLVYNNGINPYLIEPDSIGILREDTPYTDRQEAIVQTYYMTKSELYARLYSHPKRDDIVKRITTGTRVQESEIPDAVNRIVMSQTNPTIYGNVNMDLYGVNRYKAQVAEDTVEMTELWIWNDDTSDYQVVTSAAPGIIIYDRPGASLFLKGECPFVQICPNPLPTYFWGASEVQKLIQLQTLLNVRWVEILDLLSKQVSPPTALTGFSGILDEKNFALNRAGGLLSSDMPNAKAERLAPQMPPDLFEVIHEISAMFEEVSGIGNVLQGKGESGVRSAGHASQLARLGSSRAKKRALIVEDSLEKVATLYLKLMQAYDPTHFKDTEGVPFIAEQFTNDYVVKVDAHSNSPIFTEDTKQLAFNLYKAGAIDKEALLDMVEAPGKQLLIEKLKKREKQAAAQGEGQEKPPGSAPKEKQHKKEG
jgi:hypothetical protein